MRAAAGAESDAPEESITSSNDAVFTPVSQSGYPAAPSLPGALQPLNVADLELLHHYVTQTAETIGNVHLWGEDVPRLAFQHHCILRAILSLSAFHVARQRPFQSPKFLNLAERHYEVAVREATKMLPSLNIDNCQALYIMTVLICFAGFAKGPGKGDLLVVAGEGAVPFQVLMRGTRMVLDTIGTGVVLSGILATKIQPARPQAETTWDASLVAIRDDLIPAAGLDAEVVKQCQDALTRLAESYEETALGPDGHIHVQSEYSVVLRWPYQLEPRFIEIIEDRDPVALVILAHWALLLRTLETERFWFLQGWSSHLLNEIGGIIPMEYLSWVPS